MQTIWELKSPVISSSTDWFSPLGLSPILGKILVNRGITNLQQADKFLRPRLSDLVDPFVLPDMEKAVGRIERALQDKEKIMIFGDYDVDGISAASLFYLVLNRLGAEVSYYLPQRLTEGYGLSKEGIDEARKRGASLVISVDCGMTAVEEALYAKAFGINLIITDHHLAGEIIPEAWAIINPKYAIEDYPGGELAGVGVVFKITQALYRRLGLDESELEEHLDLVALGTAADVVSLTKENRILCKYGLEQIAKSNKPGLKVLILSAGLQGKSIGTAQVVFGLAPRLNAVGRLGDAIHSIRLLVTRDENEAFQIASFLESENQKRRALNEKTQKEALELLDKTVNLDKEKAIVLSQTDWHPGILGIVAARLAESFYRPTVLVTFDQEEGKGSGRSIPGFDLFEALKECRQHLQTFGGHRQAAGLNLLKSKFEDFKKKFLEIANQRLSESDLTPKQSVDAEVELKEIDQGLVEALELLAPFGPGNMRPVFVTRKVSKADFPGIVGNNHLKLRVAQAKHEYEAIGFTLGKWAKPIATNVATLDIAYVLETNFWNGQNRIQLRIKDLKFSQ